MAIGGSAGRGRSVHQKIFRTTRLYRSGVPGSRLSTVGQTYFWGPTPPAGPGTNQNWPWTVTQVAFQADPFDASAIALYSDISIRMQALNTARGRQYELDQISAGESTITAFDPDEALNPTNTASPYYPGVKVYRRIIDQAMWPPTAAQAAAIPLNANSTFEATAAPWTAVNNAILAQVTTISHSGVGSLQITPDGVTSNLGTASEVMTAAPSVNYTLNGWMTSLDVGVVRVLRIAWYDSTKALISNSDITLTMASGVWLQANGVFQSPSNAAFMQIFSICTFAGGSIWYLDDVTITPTSAVNLLNLAGGGLGTGYDFGIDPTFEIDADGSFLPFFNPFGGASSAHVAVTVPFTGSKYMACQLVAGNGSPQGCAVTLLCIPGVTYTFSAWVMIDAGTTTVQMAIKNGPIGSTAIPTSYIRMSVTFTATDVIHVAHIQTVGTINSGFIRIDSVQLEQGAAATAFTAYGPTIYGVFNGFIERWPVSWNYSGTYGMANLTLVDALAILANQSIYGEIRNETLHQSPAYYWPLDDGQGATYFGEKSGNAGPELTIINNTNNPGTVTAGTTVKITGDPNGQAVAFTNGVVGFNTAKGSILRNPWGTPLTVGGSGATWGVTLMVNAIWPSGTAGTIAMLANPQAGWFFSLEIDAQTPNPSLFAKLVTPQGTFTTTNPNNGAIPNIEQIAFISISVSGGNTTIRCYEFFDSINFSSTTANTTVWGTSTPTVNFPYLHLDGRIDPYVTYIGPQSTYSHVALWNSALDPNNVMSLLGNMASNGEGNEPPGQRIARYIGYTGLPGGTFLDNGVSTMTASAVSGTGDTTVLDAIQNVAISDNGTFYIDENGVANFQDRDTRYFTTTPAWIFGENAAAGEIPYIEDITYDYDSTQVYNDVKCTRISGVTVFNDNGITAVGGTAADIAASRRRYGTKSVSRDLNITSDLETQDAANWLFAAHKDPMQRIATLSIEPSSNPASWLAALGIRIGDRATVKRRTRQYSAFNQTGNFTMSADYFIERVEHSRQPGSWKVTYQMSPAGAAAGLQPWLLGDPTYGILDQTTRLGY